MSDVAPLSWLARIQSWGKVWTALAFLAGNFSGVIVSGFIKYTSWYIDEHIDEQNRATLLKTLSAASTGNGARLDNVDKQLGELSYARQAALEYRQTSDAHLHALDGRADTSSQQIGDMREQLATQRERLLYILDPKARK